VPALIAAVVSSGLATFTELDSVLSVEDAYDLLEIAAVDQENRRRAEETR
jgi:hypothetical protein